MTKRAWQRGDVEVENAALSYACTPQDFPAIPFVPCISLMSSDLSNMAMMVRARPGDDLWPRAAE